MKHKTKVINSSSIQNLLGYCSENIDWYHQYMTSSLSRIASDAEYINTHLPLRTLKIVDIGAIPPLLTFLLAEAGYLDLTVIDPHTLPFDNLFLNTPIKAHHADLRDLDSLRSIDQQFNLVILSEVIEHLMANLCDVFSSVSNIISDSGYLMITTPNLKSISGLYSLLMCSRGLASKPHESIVDQYKRASTNFGYYGHLREFTSYEVIELAHSAGYRLVNLTTYTDFREPCSVSDIVIRRLEQIIPPLRLNLKLLFQKL